MPPPGQPYYGAPAGTQISPPVVTPGSVSPLPPRTIGPTNFAPAAAGQGGLSSFSPNVSPVSPGPLNLPNGTVQPPLTPVSSKPRPIYGPPGGLAYPQAYANPQGSTPTLAQAGTPKPLDVDRIIGTANPAGSSTTAKTPGVVSATQWTPAEGSTPMNATTPAAYSAPADKSAIRIVEPTASSATVRSRAIASSSASANTMPGGTSAGTLNQSIAQSRFPELTDLPPVPRATPAAFVSNNPAANVAQAPRVLSPASPTPTLASLPANASQPKPAAGSPNDLSRTSFGYDPQYRWLKGKLEYSQSTRIWRLRYIPPDGATDSYGGSVILNDSAKLNGLNPGDFVVVQGNVGRAAANQSSFAPPYDLLQIQKQ